MSDPHRTTGGFADLVGYELIEWREDHAEIQVTLERKHMNRSGFMHGGVLSTIMDAALGYVGTYRPDGEPPRRAFTLSMNCHFISATEAGATLTARARRTGGGRSVFFSVCEVTDQDGQVIGQGDGVFKYITLKSDRA